MSCMRGEAGACLERGGEGEKEAAQKHMTAAPIPAKEVVRGNVVIPVAALVFEVPYAMKFEGLQTFCGAIGAVPGAERGTRFQRFVNNFGNRSNVACRL
jgi:hypothetical protein